MTTEETSERRPSLSFASFSMLCGCMYTWDGSLHNKRSNVSIWFFFLSSLSFYCFFSVLCPHTTMEWNVSIIYSFSSQVSEHSSFLCLFVLYQYATMGSIWFFLLLSPDTRHTALFLASLLCIWYQIYCFKIIPTQVSAHSFLLYLL